MKGKRLFCFILLIFSLNCVFYAKEKDTMSLFEIDRLIRKTEYDEALLQLNLYLEKNPEQFDNVQNRISRIMNAKIRYSELAEELLDLIRNDPTNNKKIYEITAELERFERNPSDKNLQFIADLKKSAEFNYFRAQFIEIQESVAENVENKQYVAAVKKAQEGFWLYKDNFYIKWEDNPEIITSIENIVNELNTHLALFENKNYILDIQKVINEFVKEVNNDHYDDAVRRLHGVTQKLTEYNNLRTNIIKDKLKMEKAVLELQKLDPDMTDASYLPFLIHFLSGVDNVDNSGIITALNNQWHDFIAIMNDSVFNQVTKKYNNYDNGINQEYVDNLDKYIKLNEDVLSLYSLPNKDERTALANPYTDYNMLLVYVKTLSKASLDAFTLMVNVDNNKLSQELEIQKLNNDENQKNKVTYLNNLVTLSEKLEKLLPSRGEYDSSYNEWSAEYKASDYENFDGLTKDYEGLINKIFDTKNSVLDNTWNTITNYFMVMSDNLYKELASYAQSFDDYNQGLIVKLNEGTVKDIKKNIASATLYKNPDDLTQEEKELSIFYRYPNITFEMVNYVNDEIENRVNIINNYKKQLNKMFDKVPNWRNEKYLSTKVQEAISYLDEQISNIERLGIEANDAYNDAMEYSINSEVAKNEADIRFKEAERALKDDDFSLARRKLQVAVTKYDESLNNQNNEDLRVQWDSKLQKLGDEIAQRENEVVVKEVRVLKNKAKDAYFNGRFDDAEKYLNQASNKWAITNSTEDPEITNLRNFVNTAISMKTGRDILPSAPQYPEMSQLINIARTSYDAGSKLLNEGQSDLAKAQFDIALDSIQKVQYLYPLNQEAALLTLQINKIQDPVKFEEEFAAKVDTAVQLCKIKDRQQEGYANLLDYYELNPNYPGLKDIIYQVEIDIGIRQKPVDNSGKVQAKKYIAEANKLYKRAGDDLEKLNEALEKVEKALTLLPYDDEAMDLKDKITTKMGGTNKTALSIEDERLYQNAIKCLRENKIATARSIVDELLEKPQNRYSNKIKDLKKQIDARS